ncbi:hypothetical protein JTE90_027275 [Oedothorax gibbosus]|uniref:Ribosomal protein L31 n=1 Tax=Oedothorax gibbosus TaxID=931172 RepID=A0AAV6W414_9ARAC|nr:hypothetical protein JTE90_027275 [Oedothorax gibbosus]
MLRFEGTRQRKPSEEVVTIKCPPFSSKRSFKGEKFLLQTVAVLRFYPKFRRNKNMDGWKERKTIYTKKWFDKTVRAVKDTAAPVTAYVAE